MEKSRNSIVGHRFHRCHSVSMQMDLHTFMDCSALPTDEMQWEWKPSYIPLQNSTLMNLYDLSMFGTIGDVARCTKFLISHMHNSTLWLDQAYPIHVDDIHNLIGLSMEGQYVKDGFQGSGKHGSQEGRDQSV
jgi:hypothetical protein